MSLQKCSLRDMWPKIGSSLLLAMITASCTSHGWYGVEQPTKGVPNDEIVAKISLSEEAQRALDLVASELGDGEREAAFIEIIVYERETNEITEFTIMDLREGDDGLVKPAQFPIDLGRLRAIAKIEQSVEIDLIGSHCKLKHDAGGPYWIPSEGCPHERR